MWTLEKKGLKPSMNVSWDDVRKHRFILCQCVIIKLCMEKVFSFFFNENDFEHAGKTNAHSHGSCKACSERKGAVAKKIFLTVSYFVVVLGTKIILQFFLWLRLYAKKIHITEYSHPVLIYKEDIFHQSFYF